MNITLIELFKNRELSAKDLFSIKEVDKSLAYDFVKKFHYLQDAKFFAKFCYGLYNDIEDELVGVATYSNPQGISAMKSWFGLENTDQSVLELSRLCMLPSLNGTNATSFLLGGSVRQLKQKHVRAVITLADNSRHSGSIYQVCNFKYYGLTDKKSDFYCEDGRINPRGATKELRGVWLPRTQKHRYCFILDKRLKPLLQELPKPTKGDTESYDCCGGTHKVFDKRFGVHYTCPVCTGKLSILK